MGALRRMSQKNQQKTGSPDRTRSVVSTGKVYGHDVSNAHDSNVASAPLPQGGQPTCTGRHNNHSHTSPSIAPTHDEVLAAVESLYADELKPFGRILRKRIAERAVGAAATAESDALPDVDIKHLRNVCNTSDKLHIVPEEGGDWSAMIIDRDPHFVNVYSPCDLYPADLWEQASHYFEGLQGDEMCLPGGRYSCAQALVARNLPFLEGRSLGQVCHIVQLAISQKRILGYYSGAVVPYSRSQSMIKEWCAYTGAPCSSQSKEPTSTQQGGSIPLASWDEARANLRQILSNAATPDSLGMVPLSNVKRLFRSCFQVELSETMLGYSKLSELLQDPRFKDICTVQLQGHGYIVVQNADSDTSISLSLSDALPACGKDDHDSALTRPSTSGIPSIGSKEPCRVEIDASSPLHKNRGLSTPLDTPPRSPQTGNSSPLRSALASSPSGYSPMRQLWPATPEMSPGVFRKYGLSDKDLACSVDMSGGLFDTTALGGTPSLSSIHGGDGSYQISISQAFVDEEYKGGDIQPSKDEKARRDHESICTDSTADGRPRAASSTSSGRSSSPNVNNAISVAPGISAAVPGSPGLHDEPMKVSLTQESASSPLGSTSPARTRIKIFPDDPHEPATLEESSIESFTLEQSPSALGPAGVAAAAAAVGNLKGIMSLPQFSGDINNSFVMQSSMHALREDASYGHGHLEWAQWNFGTEEDMFEAHCQALGYLPHLEGSLLNMAYGGQGLWPSPPTFPDVPGLHANDWHLASTAQPQAVLHIADLI